MTRVEVYQSKIKNGSFALLSLLLAVGFLYGTRVSWLLFGFGIAFVLSSFMFTYFAFSRKPVVVIDEVGIWIKSYKKKFEWRDIYRISVTDGMIMLEVSEVDKYFADRSWLTKRFSKPIMAHVYLTTPSGRDLKRMLDDMFGSARKVQAK